MAQHKILARIIRQQKDKKRNKKKERSKAILICTWHNSIFKFSDLINTFREGPEYKLNLQTLIIFTYTKNDHADEDIRKNSAFIITKIKTD